MSPKRSLSFLLLSVTLLNLVTLPKSSAIFGLSKCEKVSKEMDNLEQQFQKRLSQVTGWEKELNLNGYLEKVFVLDRQGSASIKKIISNDPIPKIFKLSYNNRKCFTNTQKIRIKELQKLTTDFFVSSGIYKHYRYDSKCKGISRFLDSEYKLKNCYLGEVEIIVNYNEYKSIYTY